MTNLWHRNLRWLTLSAAIVVFDQISKLYFESILAGSRIIDVMPGLNFALAYNEGAAFSFLGDAGGWQRWFFVVLTVCVSLAIVYWLRKPDADRLGVKVPLSMILGGAIGNLIDRVAYGHVIDFIDVYYKQWHWPTFNIADSAISVGVVFLLIDAFRTPSK